MRDKKYLGIVSELENRLEKYGDSPQGVGWPKPEDVDTRYRVMLDVVAASAGSRVSLLDFGCGLSHLREYMLAHDVQNIEYSGLDLSEKFVGVSRGKFPSITYYCLDILEDSDGIPDFDYIVMNGIFTARLELSFEEMFEYFKAVVTRVFAKARIAIAFNVMSKQVDWEREDLFHLPFDTLATFLTKHVSRHFVVRHDYGLYEYTTYVYRRPTPSSR